MWRHQHRRRGEISMAYRRQHQQAYRENSDGMVKHGGIESISNAASAAAYQ